MTIKKATTELAAAKSDEKEKESRQEGGRSSCGGWQALTCKGYSVLTCKGRLSSEGGSNAAGVGGRVMEVLASSTGSRRGY